MSLGAGALANMHTALGLTPSAAMVGAALKRSRVKGRAGVAVREAVAARGVKRTCQGLCGEQPPAESGRRPPLAIMSGLELGPASELLSVAARVWSQLWLLASSCSNADGDPRASGLH